MPDDITLPRPVAWLSPESGQVLRDGDITNPESWAIGLHTAGTVTRLIAEAVAAEREACAQIVDEWVRMVDGADAVAAIRARSTT